MVKKDTLSTGVRCRWHGENGHAFYQTCHFWEESFFNSLNQYVEFPIIFIQKHNICRETSCIPAISTFNLFSVISEHECESLVYNEQKKWFKIK